MCAVKALSVWDKHEIAEVISQLIEKCDEYTHMLNRAKQRINKSTSNEREAGLRADYILLISNCAKGYGEAAYVLMDVIGDIGWHRATSIREMLKSNNWVYKVDKEDYLSVIDNIISKKLGLLDEINKTAKRRIKPKDAETLKEAIRTYRGAAKLVGRSLKVLVKIREMYVANSDG